MLRSSSLFFVRRSAPLLAGLLMSLQVLTGLAICQRTDGAGTSWSAGGECARRAAEAAGRTTSDLVVPAEAAGAATCVTLSGPEAIAVPDGQQLAPHGDALIQSDTGEVRAVPAPAVVARALRGPPNEMQRALRSVVLRI